MSSTELKSECAKYQTKNPISRWLVRGFFWGIEQAVDSIQVNSVLDVGTGEGHVLYTLKEALKPRRRVGIDIDLRPLRIAGENLSDCILSLGNVNNLRFADREFDLVSCAEVLEHLDAPHRAMKEITRVSAKYILLSVPNEPLWRCLNMIRGSYWSDFGNTPGHVNHWSRRAFEEFVSGYMTPLLWVRPVPWLIVLGERR
jgi:ubiquinone/menaquinone biosynthesis C-methylase UbiE